jgi:predicted dienelactone hydrolase
LAVALGIAGWFVFAPRPPSPTGPKAVGRSEVMLKDAQGRAIPVTVWYPAAGPKPGIEPVENAPLDARTPAPVVLYSPGWSAARTQSSIQAANLASHGFVVVGCDDYARDPAADPDRSEEHTS